MNFSDIHLERRVGKTRSLILLCVLIGLISPPIYLYFFVYNNPSIALLRDQYVKTIVDPETKKATYEITLNKPNTWVPLSQISKNAVQCIVISEDSAFYTHDGVDYEQLRLALEESWSKKHWIRGASTITQQMAKNVFLGQQKTLWRKIKEIVMAWAIERQLPKKRILEIYLNVIEFGRGIYGVENAARYYFNRSPAELTLKEGAFLAMLLPNPVRYSQSFQKGELSSYAEKTINSILIKLLSSHHVEEDEYYSALGERLSFEKIEEAPPADWPESE
jgi:monofunctional biosynthetic peptidoglycan transglycosylase